MVFLGQNKYLFHTNAALYDLSRTAEIYRWDVCLYLSKIIKPQMNLKWSLKLKNVFVIKIYSISKYMFTVSVKLPCILKLTISSHKIKEVL